MREDGEPFGYVTVSAPAGPQETFQSREATAVRLARHVAVLFGVDVPDNPAGRTWVADFQRVRVNEIGQGALSPDRSQPRGPARADQAALDTIASGTLQKYGPDNKAALILAGSETLFEQVRAVMDEVLGVVAISEDGKPCSPVTVMAAWALLIADVMRAQPVLTAAAIKARSVQAARSMHWSPEGDTSIVLDPSERPEPPMFVDSESTRPTQLSILDATLPSTMTLLLRREREDDASEAQLKASLIDMWCSYLLGSADKACAWITQTAGSRSHGSEAFIPLTAPAQSFVSDILALRPMIMPLGEGTADAVPVMFDPAKSTHVNRLLPRVASIPELQRLEESSQRALLMTQMTLLALFRDGDRFKSQPLQVAALRDGRLIVSRADRLWGADDPLSVYLRLRSLCFEIETRRDDLDGAGQRELGRSIVDATETLHDGWRDGVVPDFIWINTVNDTSPFYRKLIGLVEAVDPPYARDLRRRLLEYWDDATTGSGLRGIWQSTVDVEKATLDETGLISLVHNWAALRMAYGSPRETVKALRSTRDVLLPARRRTAQARHSDKAYRITLQIMVQPIYRLTVSDGPAAGTEDREPPLSGTDARWLIDTARSVADDLQGTTMGNQVLAKDWEPESAQVTDSHLNFINSLLRAQIIVSRHSGDRAEAQRNHARAVDTLLLACRAFSRKLEQSQEGGHPKAAPGTLRYSQLNEYYRQLARTAVGTGPDDDSTASRLGEAREILDALDPAEGATDVLTRGGI
ncbi:hypothetical protein [Acidipropionibacterium acidipropionici]|uniref:hypothetical protein n=1 Tax=Acidipropionibacterium acidipropionici TaxID=1748 RepID=UPI00110B1D2F|nr:hypothetical protein [Acidipropionibacterium acidipropionici]QCV96502.1 hypothetical protein FEZ30_15710 [Acidipropionibacterium acidipropionici]